MRGFTNEKDSKVVELHQRDDLLRAEPSAALSANCPQSTPHGGHGQPSAEKRPRFSSPFPSLLLFRFLYGHRRPLE